jgi:Flp pilus assembly protein TadG
MIATRTPTRTTIGNQRGSATVEITLLIPALLITFGLLVIGGRIWFARTTVNEAANSAARAASLARSAAEAAALGRSAAHQSLSTNGLRCASTSVEISTAGFGVPVGTPATITTGIDCRVAFADLLLPRIPGGVNLSATGASALDTYRSR